MSPVAVLKEKPFCGKVATFPAFHGENAPIPHRVDVTALHLEHFKCTGVLDVALTRQFAVEFVSPIRRAQIFDAFALLRQIAEGRGTSAVPAAWFRMDVPTVIAADFASSAGECYRYSVTLRRIDEKRVRVLDERVVCGEEILLLRTRYSYTLCRQSGRYGVESQAFALGKASAYLEETDPIYEIIGELRRIWLLRPDSASMVSRICQKSLDIRDSTFSNLASCIILQSMNPVVGNTLWEVATALNPDLKRHAIKLDKRKRPYLVIHRKSDLDDEGTEFANLGNAEKIMLLIAFICAMNKCISPVCAVWDSPFNWLGEREQTIAMGLFRQFFASRGELFLLV